MSPTPDDLRIYLIELPKALDREVVRLFLEHFLDVRKKPGKRLRVPYPLEWAFSRKYRLTPPKAMSLMESAEPLPLVIVEGDPGNLRAYAPKRRHFKVFAPEHFRCWPRFYVFDGTFRWCVSYHEHDEVLVKYRPAEAALLKWLGDANAVERSASMAQEIAKVVADRPREGRYS